MSHPCLAPCLQHAPLPCSVPAGASRALTAKQTGSVEQSVYIPLGLCWRVHWGPYQLDEARSSIGIEDGPLPCNSHVIWSIAQCLAVGSERILILALREQPTRGTRTVRVVYGRRGVWCLWVCVKYLLPSALHALAVTMSRTESGCVCVCVWGVGWQWGMQCQQHAMWVGYSKDLRHWTWQVTSGSSV